MYATRPRDYNTRVARLGDEKGSTKNGFVVRSPQTDRRLSWTSSRSSPRDQSDAGSAGIFSRWTNQTREAR
eukprot:27017-Pyramimonas_sp.AAC.1